MKKISLLLTIAFAFMSCNCQKKAVETTTLTSNETSANQEKQMPKFVYEANTRGFYQKITIENKIVTVSNDRNGGEKGESSRISENDWSELQSYFETSMLENLSAYNDPTQKRFYDGAAIANLKVNSNGKEYQTKDFDHGFPPVEIEKLINKIVSFGKKE